MYEYILKFKPTSKHANADALSRLPIPENITTPVPPEIVLLLEFLDKSPVTADQIRVWTRKDPVLSKVREYVEGQWPDTTEDIWLNHSSQGNWNSQFKMAVFSGEIE